MIGRMGLVSILLNHQSKPFLARLTRSFPHLPLLASLTNGDCGPENQMVLP